MSELSVISQAARRTLIQELGARRTPDETALAAFTVYRKLFVCLSVILGEGGTFALFRHSVRRTQSTFPFFSEVMVIQPNAFLNALRACLQKQKPDSAVEASIALLTSFVELLATFIGARLTSQLLYDIWPDIWSLEPQERQE